MSKSLELRVASLEAEVEALKQERPGRKPKHILVSIEGVCGIDPERDSTTCPDATLYRRQKGCKGHACLAKASEYYSEYRASRAAEEAALQAAAKKKPARNNRQRAS
jgi:hypothetical protein